MAFQYQFGGFSTSRYLDDNSPCLDSNYVNPGFLQFSLHGHGEPYRDLPLTSEDTQWVHPNDAMERLNSTPLFAPPEPNPPAILNNFSGQAWPVKSEDSQSDEGRPIKRGRRSPSSVASLGAESNFLTEKDLDRHSCSKCDEVFDTLQALDRHTRENCQRAWRCQENGCNKTYTRRDTFLRHRMTHGNNSHACPDCLIDGKQKLFKRKDHLGEHMRKCHQRGSGSAGSGRASTHGSSADFEREPVGFSAVVKCKGCSNEKQRAMKHVMTSLNTVLGEHDPSLIERLNDRVTGMSGQDIQSVAATMAGVALAKTPSSPG